MLTWRKDQEKVAEYLEAAKAIDINNEKVYEDLAELFLQESVCLIRMILQNGRRQVGRKGLHACFYFEKNNVLVACSFNSETFHSVMNPTVENNRMGKKVYMLLFQEKPVLMACCEIVPQCKKCLRATCNAAATCYYV